jgi:histidinol-phosphate/aromatic aminotransferase/cobyric acid decarboxylase-like protein
VVIPAPSFGEFARMFPDARRYQDLPGIDWSEVERLAADADVLVIVNPNNPTGTVVPTERICDLAQRHPALTVVVDESFLDFSDETSIVGQLSDSTLSNVLVLRSLSKVLGVPGLRLGAVATSDPVMSARIRTETPIWNLSSVAENFLEVMLKHRPALEQSIAQTVIDREDLTRQLKERALVDSVFPSGGDFVLVRLTVDAVGADAWARWLVERRGILVKDVSPKFRDGLGYWRLAVRTPADHERLASGLDSLLDVL